MAFSPGDRVQYSTRFLSHISAPRGIHASDGRGTVAAVKPTVRGGPVYLKITWDKPELHECGGALSCNIVKITAANPEEA
jgi:hypothetical protein